MEISIQVGYFAVRLLVSWFT